MLSRFHIYSWKKSPASMQNSKHSISSVNLSSLEKDSLIETLDSKLSTFNEKSNNTQEQVEEEEPAVEDPIEKVDAKDDCDSDNDTSDHNSDSEAECPTSDEESEASTYVHDNEERKEAEEGEEEDEDEKEDKTIFHDKKDVSLSPRERDLSCLSTEEKVQIWLPQAQTQGRDIQISIDESQKLALLAKLNEIDSDNLVIEDTDSRLRSSAVPGKNSDTGAETNNNQQERKNHLMAELFGEKSFIGRRKNTFTIESKPLKTSLRTSPSGASKSVKFLEDSQF